MLPNSLRIRGVHFAFLFGPPRFVERAEASEVHGKVCDALKMDDITFRYSSAPASEKPESRGFSIALERKEGRGSFDVTIDNKTVNEPIRLLLGYTWPPSREDAKQTFDMAAEAAMSSLKGSWHRVLAEVRLLAQCDTREHDGLAFIEETLLGQAKEWLSALGEPLSFCGMRFEVAATPPNEDSLQGPKRELSIEVLREDPGGVYLELMSQWPQIPPMPRVQASVANLGQIRQIDRKPSEYIEDAYDYLVDRAESLPSRKMNQ
jgi:hypothetical protein